MQLKKIVAAGAMGLLMAGSSIAFAATLADYPSPFISGAEANVLIVYGATAAPSDVVGGTNIAARLGGATTGTTTGGTTVVVTDGDTEEVVLGANIASSALDTVYNDDDLSTLQDTTVTINGTSYDIHDEIQLVSTANNLDIETALTSNDDDYLSNIYLEVAKGAIQYCLIFDETIDLDAEIDEDNPMEVQFLGKKLKITTVDDADTFTAQVGTEANLNVDESVEVNSKTITLKNVGSSSTCTVSVDVDGVTETVTGTETVNGIEIAADECFYEDTKADRSATLIVGTDATETYDDGDAYIGQDEDDPDWIWDMGTLTTSGSGTTNDICVENNFVKDDFSDTPMGIGKYYTMPNDFAKVGVASLTVPDTDYVTVTVKHETGVDLSDASEGTSETVISIKANVDEAFELDYGATGSSCTWTDDGSATADVKTDTIYLLVESAVVETFYVNSDNDVVRWGNMSSTNAAADTVTIGWMNYKDTKATDMLIKLTGFITTTDDSLYLGFDPTTPTTDQLWVRLGVTADTSFDQIGATADTAESTELTWAHATPASGTAIGAKEDDMRTQYGIVVKDPESNGDSDKEVFLIPGDQVKGNAVVETSKSVTTTSGGATAAPIKTAIAKLDTDVTSADKSTKNLILVGGPAVNTLVAELGTAAKTKTRDWYVTQGAGTAIIDLVADAFATGKYAMVVAGTDAADTTMACAVVQDYGTYALSGNRVIVTGTVASPVVKAE